MVQTGGKLTCRNSRTARTLRRVSVLRPAPSSCRNSKTARTLFRVSVLWWAASYKEQFEKQLEALYDVRATTSVFYTGF